MRDAKLPQHVEVNHSSVARGGSAVVATHNLSRAFAMADRFVFLRDGAVSHRAEKVDFDPQHLRELYAAHAEELRAES